MFNDKDAYFLDVLCYGIYFLSLGYQLLNQHIKGMIYINWTLDTPCVFFFLNNLYLPSAHVVGRSLSAYHVSSS